MAHVAITDSTNTVVNVVVIRNEELPDGGAFSADCEEAARVFLTEIGVLSTGQNALLTSYNGNFRYNFAGIGGKFIPDAGSDGAFITPKPFPSWVLNSDFKWDAPAPKPGPNYYWSEPDVQWVELSGDSIQ